MVLEKILKIYVIISVCTVWVFGANVLQQFFEIISTHSLSNLLLGFVDLAATEELIDSSTCHRPI